MADISFELRGLDTVAGALATLATEDRKVVARALFEGGERVVARAKELVPVDTGVLRGTGHVALPPDILTDLVVTPTFGGPAAPYALIQHERTDFHHRVGQAKYLQTAMQELAPAVLDGVAQQVEAFHQQYAAASLAASKDNRPAPPAPAVATPRERYQARTDAAAQRAAAHRARGGRR